MLLAQLLGLYFIIVGVAAIYRRKSFMPAIAQLANNRALMLVIALAELMAGLAIVLTYPDLTWDANGLISLIGWMLLVEGVVYLAAPSKKVQKFVRRFNHEKWYGAGGAVAVAMGAYLAATGFGFI